MRHSAAEPQYKAFKIEAVMISFGSHPVLKITAPKGRLCMMMLSRFITSCHADKTRQAAYLEHHKLMTDAGRESLPADAFEPVCYATDE